MKKIILSFLFISQVLHLTAKGPVDDFLDNPVLCNANVGLLVRDVNTGKTIYEHRPSHSITPASTMKVITTASALELLGPGFRFQTKLQIEGEIDEKGMLYGNLYIYGGGDPTLESEFLNNRDFLNQWVDAVKKAGIKSISGRIVADAALFDDEGINPKWSWEDIGNYYASGVYGISYMDNTVRVYLKSGAAGTVPAIVKTIPAVPGLYFNNNLRSSAIRTDSSYFYGSPQSNSRTIYGEVPANKDNMVTKMDMPNPGLLLAQHFHDKLRESGIHTGLEPMDENKGETGRRTIHTHYSPTLDKIIKVINVTSNNHYAEHLLRCLALQNSAPASTGNAIKVVRNYWKSKGLPIEQLFMYDGSGLSPSNAVSAEFFVQLLTYMKKQSSHSKVFYDSLPVAGESGTISWIWKKTPLKGRLRAKSGSISLVRCYTGYIDLNDKHYAFAVMTNNYNGRPNAVVKKIESFLVDVVK